MHLNIAKTKRKCGAAAAQKAAKVLRRAIGQKGKASFVVATGASQFDFLSAFTGSKGINWSKTTMYHLDEYISLEENHPASFRHYLKKRLVDVVHPGKVYFIRCDAPDSRAECSRLGDIISQDTIDLACVGIGENGHLAFNDPPADFETTTPFILVKLDDACRRQQLGEKWFDTLEQVPKTAISMSMQQIMKAQTIVCTVPDRRKSRAVRDCLEGEVSPLFPASLLREHPQSFIYLDQDSSSLLHLK